MASGVAGALLAADLGTESLSGLAPTMPRRARSPGSFSDDSIPSKLRPPLSDGLEVTLTSSRNQNAWPRVLAGALTATVPILFVVIAASRTVVPAELVQVVILVALAYAVFRWPARRWVLILATALAALALVGSLPYVLGDLSHPESGWAFVPSALAIVALLVAVLAGIAATLRASDAPARALAASAVALAVVLTLVGVVATLRVEDDPRAEGDIVVQAKDTRYPRTVAANAGEVGLYLENKDLIRHTFVIDDRDVRLELPGSASRHIRVALTAGTYAFHCDIPGHESMKGTIEVK